MRIPGISFRTILVLGAYVLSACLLEAATNATPSAAAHPLVWDATTKKHVETGTNTSHDFIFAVTNRGGSNVVINSLHPSCGCMVARMPVEPWTLAPGESGEIFASVNFNGLLGSFSKSLYVSSSAGEQVLEMEFEVNPPTGDYPQRRQRDLEIARSDRQAVFRDACARCHKDPALGKTGEQFYDSACGICHDSPNRASFVPRLSQKITPSVWTSRIRDGGPKLMPAFSDQKGGFLTEAQIEALIPYLKQKFSPASKRPPKPQQQPKQ